MRLNVNFFKATANKSQSDTHDESDNFIGKKQAKNYKSKFQSLCEMQPVHI